MPKSAKVIVMCCFLLIAWRYARGHFINPLTASLIREGMPYQMVEIILCGPPRQTEHRLPIETFSHDTYCRREGFRYPGDDKVHRLWFSDAAWIYLVFDKHDRVIRKEVLRDRLVGWNQLGTRTIRGRGTAYCKRLDCSWGVRPFAGNIQG
jgi:hypothetical protein